MLCSTSKFFVQFNIERIWGGSRDVLVVFFRYYLFHPTVSNNLYSYENQVLRIETPQQ